MALSLGIHSSEIKVVRVWTGSVNIEYFITSSNNDTVALKNTEAKMKEKIISGTLDVGAPIIDMSIDEVPINWAGSQNQTIGNET